MSIETKIEDLRKEFNSKLDEILKPKFEVGKWYKHKIKYGKGIAAIVNFQGYNNFAYGLNLGGDWTTEFSGSHSSWNDGTVEQTTPKEVEEALIKEAEKRGFKEGVKVDRSMFKNMELPVSIYDEDFTPLSNEFSFLEKDNTLRIDGYGIFYNGKWAEIVKTKTIDEIAREFSIFQINYPDNSTYKDFKDFCIENKQDIINALNNL